MEHSLRNSKDSALEGLLRPGMILQVGLKAGDYRDYFFRTTTFVFNVRQSVTMQSLPKAIRSQSGANGRRRGAVVL